MTRSRPVKARAADRAIRLASVPELVKRTRSIEPKRAQIASARSTSYRVCAPRLIPSCSASAIALRTTGFECPYSPAEYSPSRSTY